ncbi:MAG: hypothetical protein IT532_01990 [Burkholderiales bacterium]|nr:hypothetical protein [Burkholderiales bacterium]
MTRLHRPHAIRFVSALASGAAMLAAALPLRAEEIEVLWADPKCEMFLMQKQDGEFGTVLRLTVHPIRIGDRIEGDFAHIDQIRKVKNLDTGDDIMVRGVRYSTSRKWVLRVLPKWCKGPTE